MKFTASLFATFFAWTLVSCATSPTGRQQLVLMPESQMDALGVQSFEQIKKQTPVERDPAINRYVQCVSHALLGASRSGRSADGWEIVVFRSQQVNAFALPGAKIGVYTGLLKVAETPDQLAAVVGHEIGHVMAQHSNERVSEALATQAGMVAAGELMRDNKNRNVILAALGVGAQFGLLLPHSRTQESESDSIGLELMASAGFNPKESVELWRNMARASEGAPPEFLSTHPSHSTRIQDLSSQMGGALQLYNRALGSGRAPNCQRPRI